MNESQPPVTSSSTTGSNSPTQSPVPTPRPTGVLRARVISLGACVLFLVFGLYLISRNNIDASWTHTVGEVAQSRTSTGQNSERRDITVKYTVAGHDYNIYETVSADSKSSQGAKREVAYNPSAPADAKLIKNSYDNAIPWAIVVVSVGLIVYLFAIFFVKKQPIGRVE